MFILHYVFLIIYIIVQIELVKIPNIQSIWQNTTK